MIYHLDVALTKSGIDWADAIPVPTSMTEAEYDALPEKTVLVRDGYTIDLGEGTSTGFAYADIVGKTVNQIRDLFPNGDGDYDHTYAHVHVTGDGDFTIFGSPAGERLYGGAGNDILYDGGNAGFEYELDLLAGGAGDDTYYIEGVDSTVFEKVGEGFDRVYADGFFILSPNSEVEFVKVSGEEAQAFGNQLSNIMVGSDQSGLIAGQGGNDTLRSDGGDTVFEGGTGNDAMRGGAGADVFLYYGNEQGRDSIQQFGDQDVLVTTTKIYDGNGDNIITFGSDKRLDFSSTSSVRISDESGHVVKSLEYDGSYAGDSGVTYYVYSRVGSDTGVSTASGNDLVDFYSYYQ